jgi:hypothetical protein
LKTKGGFEPQTQEHTKHDEVYPSIEFKEEDFEETIATTPEEIRLLGTA